MLIWSDLCEDLIPNDEPTEHGMSAEQEFPDCRDRNGAFRKERAMSHASMMELLF